jgi:lantibiotic leader peptide-processing serine protease
MLRSTRRFSLVSSALVLALGGCAPDVTPPSPAASTGSATSTLSAVSAPRSSVASTAAGQYLVLLRGKGIPEDFAGKVTALGGTVTFSHARSGLAIVAGLTDATAAQLAEDGEVADVKPDAAVTLDVPVAPAEVDAGAPGVASQGNPTTAARYAWQWNMRAIQADQAWAAGKLGSSDVTVAILDTGIDYDAYDLSGLVDLTRSASFVPSDDQITSTYFPTRNVISDYDGHGTNVATQVSSKAVALAGVTSRTTLIGVKVLNAQGSGSLGGILAGVLWAADHGADVANMSLGGAFLKAGAQGLGGFINRVFNYAASRGMLIVVAAGNDGADLDHLGGPVDVTFCSEPQVICVSAVGPTVPTGSPDAFAFYSNYGRSEISVAGPGGNGGVANSTWPWGTGAYSWVWSLCSKTLLVLDDQGNVLGLAGCQSGNYLLGYIGTSQATPHVSGLAALLVSERGHGHPSQIKAAILKSAVDLGQPGTDPYYGRGRIDVARAVGLP